MPMNQPEISSVKVAISKLLDKPQRDLQIETLGYTFKTMLFFAKSYLKHVAS